MPLSITWAGSGMPESCRCAATRSIGASPDGAPSNHADHPVIAQLLPRQAEHQGIELGPGKHQRPRSPGPTKAPLMEPPASEPDPLAVVDQHLHPRTAPVGKEVSMMGARFAKDAHHLGEERVHAPPATEAPGVPQASIRACLNVSE